MPEGKMVVVKHVEEGGNKTSFMPSSPFDGMDYDGGRGTERGSIVYSFYGSAVSTLNKRSSYVGEGSEAAAHKGGSHGLLGYGGGGGATSMDKAEGRDAFLHVEDMELMLHRACGSLLVGAHVLEPIIRKASDGSVTY